jgi:hypothetical protein
MNNSWKHSSANISVLPAMKFATSRILDTVHRLSTNKHFKIGLAIVLPSLAFLLSTISITGKLTQAWRRATGQTLPEENIVLPEIADQDTNDKSPKLPEKSYGQLLSEKRSASPEHNEHGIESNNIVYNNDGGRSSSLESPKKSYSADAASVKPLPLLTPDNASVNSASSSEHSRKRKFRLGKNIKKRWQNRPLGHGSSESPLSP